MPVSGIYPTMLSVFLQDPHGRHPSASGWALILDRRLRERRLEQMRHLSTNERERRRSGWRVHLHRFGIRAVWEAAFLNGASDWHVTSATEPTGERVAAHEEHVKDHHRQAKIVVIGGLDNAAKRRVLELWRCKRFDTNFT